MAQSRYISKTESLLVWAFTKSLIRKYAYDPLTKTWAVKHLDESITFFDEDDPEELENYIRALFLVGNP
jgi:hypothetical protein